MFYSFGYHLRRSHMWLSWGRTLSRIVISPAQHHIHHSFLPQHCNKGYGEMFAFWDWMFGTIYIPEKHEELKLGTGLVQPRPNLWRAYAVPFLECYCLLRLRPFRSGSQSALLIEDEAVRLYGGETDRHKLGDHGASRKLATASLNCAGS
jgi:hypothetical protein